MEEITAVVLAATDNSEMCSDKTKFIHHIAGKPLIKWIYDTLKDIGADDCNQLYVVGNHQPQIRGVIGDSVAYVLQENPQGTGHAVCQASSFLEGRSGITIVITGNTPLVSKETLASMIRRFKSGNYHGLVLSATTDTARNYDRPVKDGNDRIIRILKDEDCDKQQNYVSQEVISGIYCFDTAILLSMIGRLGSMMQKDENKSVSFAKIVEYMSLAGYNITSYMTDFDEIIKVNTRVGLEEARLKMSWRICKEHMRNGVTIMDPSSTRIDYNVTIGKDCEISPGSVIKGETHIGSHVRISRACSIEQSIICDNCLLEASNIKNSFISQYVHVGPYSHIHDHCKIGAYSKIASFCDLEHTVVGEACLINPHSILHSVKMGKSVYFGSSSIAEDEDLRWKQVNKIRQQQGNSEYLALFEEDSLMENDIYEIDSGKLSIKIDDHAHISDNVSILAPVEIQQHAFISTGSVIYKNVPEFSLAGSRIVQDGKALWVKERYNQGKSLNPRSAARLADTMEAVAVEQIIRRYKK